MTRLRAGRRWFTAMVLPIAMTAATAMAQGDGQHARFVAESHAAMTKMMTAMGATPIGDVDIDFATMMIAHHVGAIEMAQAQLRAERNEQLRRLAQEIVVTQQQEVDVMRRVLGRRAEPATPEHDDSGVSGYNQRAGTATAGASAITVSHRDRVYAAEQFSNTVSVTDPADNRLLGVIRLGEPMPANLSPLYRGQLLVHGIGVSPDHRTLAVVSIGSNSVTFIDTATNAVQHVTYVGRSPHEVFFTPDGREVRVTVRGESYVAVIDGTTYEERARIAVPNGPACRYSRPTAPMATSAPRSPLKLLSSPSPSIRSSDARRARSARVSPRRRMASRSGSR
jgi:YVTN family beta-propeller protein